MISVIEPATERVMAEIPRAGSRRSTQRVATVVGGFKQSGYGRELGPHALDAYTELKSIYYATS
jgi:Aldehyde dehydrogenase family